MITYCSIYELETENNNKVIHVDPGLLDGDYGFELKEILSHIKVASIHLEKVLDNKSQHIIWKGEQTGVNEFVALLLAKGISAHQINIVNIRLSDTSQFEENIQPEILKEQTTNFLFNKLHISPVKHRRKIILDHDRVYRIDLAPKKNIKGLVITSYKKMLVRVFKLTWLGRLSRLFKRILARLTRLDLIKNIIALNKVVSIFVAKLRRHKPKNAIPPNITTASLQSFLAPEKSTLPFGRLDVISQTANIERLMLKCIFSGILVNRNADEVMMDINELELNQYKQYADAVTENNVRFKEAIQVLTCID